MDQCLDRSELLNRKPVAYLICNQSPPGADGTPSLMTFRDVETLFHEFGHGLQHMLTTVPYSDAAGIRNVEWDAVELPSQFMENWLYDKTTMNLLVDSWPGHRCYVSCISEHSTWSCTQVPSRGLLSLNGSLANTPFLNHLIKTDFPARFFTSLQVDMLLDITLTNGQR